MKVVIDTNGFLSTIPTNGSNKWLYHAFMEERFIWVFSNEILTEYAEMTTLFYGQNTASFVINSLLSSINHLKFEPSYKWQLVIKDPDDDKFVDCAIGANVDYLVTDDKHIKSLLKIPDLFPPVPVISFKEFEKIIRN
jgi:putative PIN family toxin of toxin-antitoxin system